MPLLLACVLHFLFGIITCVGLYFEVISSSTEHPTGLLSTLTTGCLRVTGEDRSPPLLLGREHH